MTFDGAISAAMIIGFVVIIVAEFIFGPRDSGEDDF